MLPFYTIFKILNRIILEKTESRLCDKLLTISSYVVYHKQKAIK